LTIIGTFGDLKCHLNLNPGRTDVDDRQRSHHHPEQNPGCIFEFLKMTQLKLCVILGSFIRKRAETGIIV
jgi:hypothetical protein